MKNILKAIILCFVILCITFTAGCQKPEPVPTGFPVTAAGVTLDAKPQRVVCLTAGAVDAVKYFAGEDIIVGVCDNANLSSDVMNVGTAANADADKIIGLSCDLVFTNEKLSEAASQKLALAGVKVAILPVPVYYNELKQYYSNFANLLFGTINAESKIAAAMTAVTATATEAAPSALLIPYTDTVATPDTVMGQLLSCAGYKNAAEGCVDFIMSKEAIFDAAPQIIFCGKGIKDTLASDPVLSKIPAVLNNKVYEIDTDALRLPGNRFAQVIEDMKAATAANPAASQSDTSSTGE